MKKTLLIGLNDESRKCAGYFKDRHHLLAAIDSDLDRIMSVADDLSAASFSGDYDLGDVDVSCFDNCLLCLENDQISLIDLLRELKKLNARRIIVVNSEGIAEDILLENGADEVVALEDLSSWLLAED